MNLRRAQGQMSQGEVVDFGRCMIVRVRGRRPIPNASQRRRNADTRDSAVD
jgi:hypothetical protein